jgi:methylmalonyl-CoA mutase
LPDEFSSRIARNIQIVLKEESYLDKVVDPSAGSYYIESLTDEIAQMAWNLFKTTEKEGGILDVMEKGQLKKDIEKVAAQRDMDIAMRKTPVLGTNIFPNQKETMLEEYTNKFITDEDAYLKLYRGAEAFENLRLATETYVKEGGACPKVFLATFGNLAMRKARATFAANFFACAGYEIMCETLSKEIETMVKEIIASKAGIVVLCSSDEEYLPYGCELAAALKKKNKKIQVIIAGYPKDSVDVLKTAGVDDFIHVRVNVIESLTGFQKKFGIIK